APVGDCGADAPPAFAREAPAPRAPHPPAPAGHDGDTPFELAQAPSPIGDLAIRPSIGPSAAASRSAAAGARKAPAMPSASALKRVSGLISRVNATTGTPDGAPARQRRSAASRLATTTLGSPHATASRPVSPRAATTRARGQRSRRGPTGT